jgi:hypothetical protein
VSERPKERASKAREVKTSESSNLSATASLMRLNAGVALEGDAGVLLPRLRPRSPVLCCAVRVSRQPGGGSLKPHGRHNVDVTAPSDGAPPTGEIESRRLAYEMLTQRQLEHQTLSWQTPGLSLTAQAFLLTTALGDDSTSLARIVAATIGLCIGVLSMQLMDKHRVLGRLELAELDGQGQMLGLPQVTHIDPSKVNPKALPDGRRKPAPLRWWQRPSSQKLWQVGLGSFVAANGLVLGLVLTGHSDLLAK